MTKFKFDAEKYEFIKELDQIKSEGDPLYKKRYEHIKKKFMD